MRFRNIPPVRAGQWVRGRWTENEWVQVRACWLNFIEMGRPNWILRWREEDEPRNNWNWVADSYWEISDDEPTETASDVRQLHADLPGRLLQEADEAW